MRSTKKLQTQIARPKSSVIINPVFNNPRHSTGGVDSLSHQSSQKKACKRRYSREGSRNFAGLAPSMRRMQMPAAYAASNSVNSYLMLMYQAKREQKTVQQRKEQQEKQRKE